MVLEFKKNGEEFLNYFIKLCELQPNERILDVGSGIGRKAIPLTKYLDSTSRYEGLEIVEVGVEWCRKHISRAYQNFHFQLADVYNEWYKPNGRFQASEYKFPYENGSFDIIVLGSVFTHMLPKDMENYLSEISRVLRTEGRCLISFFLLTEESLELLQTNKSTLDFKYDIGKYRTVNKIIHEDAVSYHETYILDLYKKNGLNIRKPIHYRSWSGRKEFLSYQDIIIATKY
ncbi:MAG: class I SAM-dependent methyltransferase [Bacteroidetes bacterium]|nr:class I SAM-dependent methyltransferase [Bacteroidota bacterium]